MLKATVLMAVAKAKVAVQDLAEDAVLMKRVPAPHVPGQAAGHVSTPYPIKLVRTSYHAREIDGDRIRASDYKGLVFTEIHGKIPEPNDLVNVGPLSYRVLVNDKVMAGDSVALSQLQLRQ